MKNQTFTLEMKNGKLIITEEIKNHLSKLPDNVKVFLTIQSESNNLSNRWNKWFDELEKIEPCNDKINIENEYQKLLINKYKKQGLEL